MTTYNAEQRYENYKRLIKDINDMKNGKGITQDHINYFKDVRKFYYDFNSINLDITHEKFRKKANETEQIARYLQLYLSEHKTLEPVSYLQILERFKYLFESTLTADEIAILMEDLKV